jgi:hypothetical protein
MKSFIFVGDSLTWGEGLELYDKKFKDTFIELTNKGDFRFFDYGDILFSGYAPLHREKYRYPSLVSSYFDTVYFSNGISENNIVSIDYVIKLHEKYGSDKFGDVIINLCSTNHDEHITSKEKLKDLFDVEFKLFELQKILESWYNYCGEFGVNDEIAKDESKFNKHFSNTILDLELIERFQSYFFQPENFRKFLIQNSYEYLEEKLSELDKLGIKYHILLPWTSHDYENYNKVIQKFDLDLTNNTIPIFYKGAEYQSLAELLNKKEMWINSDLGWSNCYFLSQEGHKIVSESIIKYLENLDM